MGGSLSLRDDSSQNFRARQMMRKGEREGKSERIAYTTTDAEMFPIMMQSSISYLASRPWQIAILAVILFFFIAGGKRSPIGRIICWLIKKARETGIGRFLRRRRTGQFYRDRNGYLRDIESGRLVHRNVAYHGIYLRDPAKYPLPFAEYQVHHLNGRKDDNRVENLMIVTKEEHLAIHEKQWKRRFFRVIR